MRVVLIVCMYLFAMAPGGVAAKYVSPLAAWSDKWSDPKYQVCNTAANARYMTEAEREIIHILNLVRMNPKLFCNTVLKNGTSISEFIDPSSEEYYQTLVTTLSTMEPLPLLQPDSLCMVSARCHAKTSGKKGYVGHNRQSDQCRKNKHFMGECCNYGSDKPLEIILLLLQDKDIPDLGHRKICLGNYSKIGVAIESHKTYSFNAVMDFY
ncbi:MAG: hypothetical protein K9G49_02640 [Taibaiella sp.]|nr:hypothetical protein [Taibaiella sp.]